MKTAVLAFVLLVITACAAQSPDDGTPTSPYSHTECSIADGVWRVESTLETTDTACLVDIDSWRFDATPQLDGLTPANPATCTRNVQDLDNGCHRNDVYVCALTDADGRSAAEARIVFKLDFESESRLTGSMVVAFDTSNMSCSATYSVVLTKE